MPKKNAALAPPEPNMECVRSRIIASAISLFCQKGYEASSVREIVQMAGVTKPALYYYFKNKEDLFHFVIHEPLADFQKRIGEACSVPCSSFKEQLDAIEGIYVDAALKNPDLVRLINSLAFSGLYEWAFDFHGFWKKNLSLIFAVFKKAQKKGWIRSDIPAEALAYNFAGMTLGIMRGIAFFPEYRKKGWLRQKSSQIILEGIAPNKRNHK